MSLVARLKDWRPYRVARHLWLLATSRRYRVAWLIQRENPPNLFQPFTDTEVDRYPRLFRYARENLPGGPAVRLLSFGCSTGEEVFTLRHYFPEAAIRGIDINRANIKVCQRKLRRAPDPGIDFLQAGSTQGEETAAYDAIFCMAVLRNGNLALPDKDRSDLYIRFEDFAATVADFDRCLKPGGLLFIVSSSFRFADTPTASGFEAALQRQIKNPSSPRARMFDEKNREIPGAVYSDTVFRKRGMRSGSR